MYAASKVSASCGVKPQVLQAVLGIPSLPASQNPASLPSQGPLLCSREFSLTLPLRSNMPSSWANSTVTGGKQSAGRDQEDTESRSAVHLSAHHTSGTRSLSWDPNYCSLGDGCSFYWYDAHQSSIKLNSHRQELGYNFSVHEGLRPSWPRVWPRTPVLQA